MESIRKAALQAELNNIEAEAEAKSYAIMNRADQLAAAHQLCALVNDVVPKYFTNFKPYVTYQDHGKTCDIAIYASANGDAFIRRLATLKLNWEDGGSVAMDLHDISVEGYKGIHVYLYKEYLAAKLPEHAEAA